MRERILILVKTYPVLSKTYFELVCTAGINEQGQWRRLYPIPFRQLSEMEQYQKYQWIEVDIQRNTSDIRPESFRPSSEIHIRSQPLSTDNGWEARRDFLFNEAGLEVHTDLQRLIERANSNELSLALFKPSRIIDFVFEDADPEWDPNKLAAIEQENQQMKLFDDMRQQIQVVEKLPYKFSYKFADCNGKESTLMVEDWEVGALYRNCYLRRRDKAEAAQLVADKYRGFIRNNDLHFFLGTTQQFHGRARNPFLIIGVFYPPKPQAQPLFDS